MRKLIDRYYDFKNQKWVEFTPNISSFPRGWHMIDRRLYNLKEVLPENMEAFRMGKGQIQAFDKQTGEIWRFDEEEKDKISTMPGWALVELTEEEKKKVTTPWQERNP